MATVYLALDRRLDREVAVKVMHAHLADDEQFTARFIREARSAARLSHPNVVQVYDQGSDGDLLYLAMEYLRGRTLREVLIDRRVLTAREALTVVEPLLDALAAAHSIGIVHRDIKPENVILTDDGRVKVADFGLARAATTGTSATGTLIGTVAYLAPELVLRGVADARTDVYAVGIMLFEMLTGRLPFVGDVPIQVAYQHVNDVVPAPSSVTPEVDARLDSLVETATTRNPDDRPADAGAMLSLATAVHEQLSPAELDTRPAPPALPSGGEGAPSGETPLSLVTEIFVPPVTHHPTQALPDLEVLAPPRGGKPSGRDLRLPPPNGRTRPPALSLPGPEVHGDREPVDTEDAALAVLLRRRRVIGISALLSVLVLALGLAGAAWYFAIGPGAFTTTPAVTGMKAPAAAGALRGAGLRSTQREVYDAASPPGTVVSTDPDAGAPVRKDGSVELQVSKGPEFVVVPKVLGQSEGDARQAIDSTHLSVSEAVQEFDDAPKGQVIAVRPDAGQRVRNGSAVALTVSKGPEPVAVPDVVGRSKDDAERQLIDGRLEAAYGPAVFDGEVAEGSVVSQSPKNGTLGAGQKVTLVLSKGPEMVTVPNVVGKQFSEARTALREAGFDVRRANVLGGYFGTVRIQIPGGGSTAPKGSAVVVTVV
ncbi:MAG: eukaryotic-like serine/threonine-protein kinase [Actinomycetota bacterium]|nr:eukaryotic-like serine/threonine-protein kinase [Actinomycetota bacterium]